jgi:hypothetical protein
LIGSVGWRLDARIHKDLFPAELPDWYAVGTALELSGTSVSAVYVPITTGGRMSEFTKYFTDHYGVQSVDAAIKAADAADKNFGTATVTTMFLRYLDEKKQTPPFSAYLAIGHKALECHAKKLQKDVGGRDYRDKSKSLMRQYDDLLAEVRAEITQSQQQITVVDRSTTLNGQHGVDWECVFTLAAEATQDGFLLQHVQFETKLPKGQHVGKLEFWEHQGDIIKGQKSPHDAYDTYGIDPALGSGAKTLMIRGWVMFFYGRLPLYFRPELDPSIVPLRNVTNQGVVHPAVKQRPHFPIDLSRGSPHNLDITWDDKLKITCLDKTTSLAGSPRKSREDY